MKPGFQETLKFAYFDYFLKTTQYLLRQLRPARKTWCSYPSSPLFQTPPATNPPGVLPSSSAPRRCSSWSSSLSYSSSEPWRFNFSRCFPKTRTTVESIFAYFTALPQLQMRGMRGSCNRLWLWKSCDYMRLRLIRQHRYFRTNNRKKKWKLKKKCNFCFSKNIKAQKLQSKSTLITNFKLWMHTSLI